MAQLSEEFFSVRFKVKFRLKTLLNLTSPIGLPPHTPVAHKIADQLKTDLDIKSRWEVIAGRA